MNRFVLPMLSIFLWMGCSQEAPRKSQQAPEPNETGLAKPQIATESAAKAASPALSPKDMVADSVTPAPSKLAVAPPKMDRKVIRTADLHFKVASTEQTTYKIEQITKSFGGYVTHTDLQGHVIKQFDLPSGNDSMAHITHYEVQNTMILRVPNAFLDTVLAAFSHLYLFLEHRRISGEDVTTTYAANRLKAQLRERVAHRLENAADDKGKRLGEIADLEHQAAGLQETAIDERLRNLQNDYNIEYSEVKLLVYQEPNVLKTTKANPTSERYTPSFAVRAMGAIQTSWAMILELVIGVLHLWSVILLAIGVWWAYKKVKQSKIFTT
jgi:Domain of unknown function (DUF4349)